MQKCNGPNGAVIFQDQPCAGSGVTVADDIKARAAQITANRATEQNKKTSRAIEEEEPQIAIAKAECRGLFPDYPHVGMRETTFLQCTHLGRFWTDRTINETATQTSLSKQYVFGGAPGMKPDIKFLYTRDGVVTAIQR